MGKRRFEYAAAFFLLADDAGSAVSLLAGQCGDIGLAVAVARLYGGEQSECLQTLVRQRLLPRAEQENDRWLMSWCFLATRKKLDAANALIRPLTGVRYWEQDDPRTMVLYRQLRHDKSEQEEYLAVLRAARILRRMGFWMLALEMVKGWEFKHVSSASHASGETASIEATTNGVHHERPTSEDHAASAPSLLDSFSSSPASAPEAEVVDEKSSREAKAAALLAKLQAKKAQSQQPPSAEEKERPKPPPTQFKEPDANSLLDSFGF